MRSREPTSMPRSGAWIASTVLHALLLVGLFQLIAPSEPPGAAEEASREVGIVLRREMPEPSASFEQPVEQPSAEPQPELPAPPETVAPEEVPEEPEVVPEEVVEEFQLPVVEDKVQLPSSLAELAADLERADQADGKVTGKLAPKSPTTASGQPLRALGTPGIVRVEVFGVVGEGTRFVYAFDRSISMAGPPLEAAKRELIASLETLGEINQFQVLFFNHRLAAFDLSGGQRRVAYATEENLDRAASFTRQVSAQGTTDRYGALARALTFRPDVIFFLTDADSPMVATQMRRITERAVGQGTAIHTIEFGRGPQPSGRNFLIDLAEATDGRHGYVDTMRLPQ